MVEARNDMRHEESVVLLKSSSQLRKERRSDSKFAACQIYSATVHVGGIIGGGRRQGPRLQQSSFVLLTKRHYKMPLCPYRDMRKDALYCTTGLYVRLIF